MTTEQVLAPAPPAVLTLERYRDEWEPLGWHLLTIGPTATWRQDWGVWEAIRDIVQNALDEAEGYSWGYDAEGLWIADQGRGVQVADFLLGPPKPKPAHARGRFGEGMKIAALALLRQGHKVRVETAGREIWMLFLRQRLDGSEANTLAALWRETATARSGTVFHLVGYTGPAFEDRFAVNLPREAILFEGRSLLQEPVPRSNQLIAQPAGRIYARDIYMRDINSPWSYNLWSFPLAPDRHAPEREADLWHDVARLWCTCPRPTLVERLLGMLASPPEEDTDEARHLEFDAWSLGKEPHTGLPYTEIARRWGIWANAWKGKYGDSAVVTTDNRLSNLVEHLGYTPREVKWGAQAFLSQVLKSDRDLIKESQARLREARVLPEAELSPRARVHLRLARAIADTVLVPRVAGVHAALIPPASDRVRTAGMYSTVTREVFITADQLEQASTTVDTLVHEMAHHVSGAEDRTDEHTNAVTGLASRVMEHTTRGDFDSVLKEALW